jgi:hypothetical protein
MFEPLHVHVLHTVTAPELVEFEPLHVCVLHTVTAPKLVEFEPLHVCVLHTVTAPELVQHFYAALWAYINFYWILIKPDTLYVISGKRGIVVCNWKMEGEKMPSSYSAYGLGKLKPKIENLEATHRGG